jgi:Flp pilus assembly pilin Flp
MRALWMMLSRLWEEDAGATMVEYALLISLIAITAFSGVSVFGNSVLHLYEHIRDDIVSAIH